MPGAEQSSKSRRIGAGMAALTTLVIAVGTLTPTASSGPDLFPDPYCLICGQFGGTDAFLNTLIFIPLTAGLTLAGMRARWACLAAMAFTIAIESIQVSLIPGRDASLGDLLTNTLGGCLGAWLGRHHLLILAPSPRQAVQLLGAWMVAWLVALGLTTFALLPRATDSGYYGQTSRSLEERPPLRGELLSVRLAGLPMSLGGGEMAHTGRIREALRTDTGATMEVLLRPGPPLPQRKTIFRLADGWAQDIVNLRAAGTTVLYEVRTGAATLRLRPVIVGLRNALPPDSAAPMTIRARRSFDRAMIEAGATRVEVPMTTGNGWRLLSLVRAWQTGSVMDQAMAAAWLLVLCLPAGFWLAFAEPAARRRLGSMILGVIALGLAIGPIAGLAVPALAEPSGAIVGLVAGRFIGMLVSRSSIIVQSPS